jgi:hypothetical protein
VIHHNAETKIAGSELVASKVLKKGDQSMNYICLQCVQANNYVMKRSSKVVLKSFSFCPPGYSLELFVHCYEPGPKRFLIAKVIIR